MVIDDENGKFVGFITAITDKILSAYIPFLEVLPEYQRQGIGKELVKRMLEKRQRETFNRLYPKWKLSVSDSPYS